MSCGGSVGAGWIQLCPTQGSPWPFLTEATPATQTLPPVPIIVFLQFSLVESKDCCVYVFMECQLPAEPSTACGMNFQVY